MEKLIIKEKLELVTDINRRIKKYTHIEKGSFMKIMIYLIKIYLSQRIFR